MRRLKFVRRGSKRHLRNLLEDERERRIEAEQVAAALAADSVKRHRP